MTHSFPERVNDTEDYAGAQVFHLTVKLAASNLAGSLSINDDYRLCCYRVIMMQSAEYYRCDLDGNRIYERLAWESFMAGARQSWRS